MTGGVSLQIDQTLHNTEWFKHLRETKWHHARGGSLLIQISPSVFRKTFSITTCTGFVVQISVYSWLWLFSRFVYKGQWREKINSHVDFPTRNLDLNPYLEGPKSIKSSYRLYATSVSVAEKRELTFFTSCFVDPFSNWCYDQCADERIFLVT